MRVINAKDADEAVKLAAETFIEAADARPDAPIGLATGGTMDGIYLKLKELGFRPKTKHAFALDEYEGLEPGSQNSYAAELRDKFVQRLGWTGTLHVPGSGHYSGETGLELFEQRLTELGPISVQLLGLGSNGHIAFNEPGSDFDTTTRLVELHPATRSDNARFFPSLEDVPTHAYTQGLETISRSSCLLLVVLGERKLPALSQALTAPSPQTPLAALLDHENLTLITDQVL
jgi:glucosamine-6-phosphate deaminase